MILDKYTTIFKILDCLNTMNSNKEIFLAFNTIDDELFTILKTKKLSDRSLKKKLRKDSFYVFRTSRRFISRYIVNNIKKNYHCYIRRALIEK